MSTIDPNLSKRDTNLSLTVGYNCWKFYQKFYRPTILLAIGWQSVNVEHNLNTIIVTKMFM